MDGRAPGVLIELVEAPSAISPTRVDVPALVCVTERGPVNTPVRVGSAVAFAATFGGFILNGLGAYAAKAFFDGGGTVAWVVRVAAPGRVTATVGPQPAARDRSVVGSLDGLVPGAVATLSQPGVSHGYLVTAVDHASMTVTWDRPLHPDLDPALTMDVATGAGTARVAMPGEGGASAVEVRASSPGAWGGRVEVVASPGLRATTTPRGGTAGGALVTHVVSTAGFRIGDLCRISQDQSGTVVTAEAVVAAMDPARRTLTWASALPGTLDLTAAFTIETATFDLAVLLDGAVAETWPDLSVHPAHPRFAESVTAPSALIRVEATGTELPEPARRRMTGGRDGTAALRITDLLGDELLDDRIGLAALLHHDEPAVVVMPDLVAPPSEPRVVDPPAEPDPCDPCARPGQSVPAPLEAILVEAGASFDADEVVAAQQQVIDSCERSTERIALLDPPHDCGTFAGLRAWVCRFSSSYAVAVAPWLTVVEPSDSRAVRRVPPSGHLAGLIARCDAEAGPWLSPANRTLAWAHGLTLTTTDAQHAVANDDLLNLIRALPGRGLVPLGSRTLAADAQWRFVSVRRTMIMLRRTLRHHLAWVPFEPHDHHLASALELAIATLLTDLWEAGGLAGGGPEEAFAVAVDSSRSGVGELRIAVGVALARPAEFVIARVTRTGNRLEITEAPQLVAAGGTP